MVEKSLFLLLFLLLGRSVEGAVPHYDSLVVDSAKFAEDRKPRGELLLSVGNESNQVDGVFGPFTYGLDGNYTFTHGMRIEAAIIAVHEPGCSVFYSFLDEGQLSLNLPEMSFLQQQLAFTATLWSNRTIDMYTNVGGVEVTDRWSILSLNVGLYAGEAMRSEVAGRFLGGQAGVSRVFGPVEIALNQVAGVIRTPGDQRSFGSGAYETTSLEASRELSLTKSVPMTVTVSIEKRYFDFGNGGPANDPHDAFIMVVGVEIDLVGLNSPGS